MDKIDKIYYINLDKRTDRKVNIENQIRNNLDTELKKTKRIPGIIYSDKFINNHKRNKGSIGCSLSHIAALKDAKENKYQNIMILEDDFEFKIEKEELNKKLEYFFENIRDYNLLLLETYGAYKVFPTKFKDIFKIENSFCLGCYVVSYNFLDCFIEHNEKTVKKVINGDTSQYIDIAWRVFQGNEPNKKVYTFNTNSFKVGYQSGGYSDIEMAITKDKKHH